MRKAKFVRIPLPPPPPGMEYPTAGAMQPEGADIQKRFRIDLKKMLAGSWCDVRFKGFPTVRFQWVPVVDTAGVLVFPPFPSKGDDTPDKKKEPNPEIMVFLLNGLESAKDLQALAMRFPIRSDIWQILLNERDGPLAFIMAFTANRLREQATMTIIHGFAHAYFAMFGTSDVDE